MINQAETAGIATVAVCKETLSRMGSDKLYADIAAGKFRQVIVSPEIVISSDFRTAVLSKDRFATALRAVCIDEAHCISLWGGSFRSDYASLGVLRGRFPKNVPFVVASATLPSHVLNDVRHKLQLGSEKKMVRLTNARPNVAVSVRTMKHSEETKGDIRFLIPPDAKKPGDIPITLVYCNQRTTTEDAADRARDWAIEQGIDPDCIAFYHAYVGEKRKRELESLLEKGEMRILFFTDAVGMGCDMRNIARVVLWGLPPSFCALVQRAGRAGRDLKKLGEGILIVSPSVMKDGVTAQEVSGTVAVSGQEAEATNLNEEDLMAEVQGMEEQVSPEGVRIAADESASEGEGDNAAAGAALSQKMKRKGKASTDTDVHEANALSKFVGTKSCRRVVWDSFFENSKKFVRKNRLTRKTFLRIWMGLNF
ncbi:uncharacterized protein LACBIDRAFT_299079 [Laccaria bicolor S238N-H82]|uniref:DNA 3'-5' helicase n=1 Tax=Laccaria bicolor (strain S238N-H82 / ATCC MYA-4686) TaxID=486041 RepID=B0DDZ5_LACBS|nr:uncharacterized protein LACBIDRAFT_299079 [Laccaria bicolor S238N-H82]EDR07173.1 predicted protein [Laccaria bicolor S238N-H82]|eukprot:XP_001882104.1 predicted protein [Laccaria bicolor S238N-H82]